MSVWVCLIYRVFLKLVKSRYIYFFKIFIYFGNGQKYLNFQYFYLNCFTLCTICHEVVILDRIKNIYRLSKDTTATIWISVQEEGFWYIIGINTFSKQRRFFCFCIRSCPYLIDCHRHEDFQYSLAIWQGYHHMHSSSQQKQYMEWSMGQKGYKHKTSSTGKVKDGREKTQQSTVT